MKCKIFSNKSIWNVLHNFKIRNAYEYFYMFLREKSGVVCSEGKIKSNLGNENVWVEGRVKR